MENILKIIYDETIKNNILDLKNIEKILELLIINKSLDNYILNMNIQPIRSKNLASYSAYNKNITIYSKQIEQMIKDIEKSLLNSNKFEKLLYKNLSILQILLHEIEHANQQKIAYNENNFEAFLIRLSYMIKNPYDEKMYEYCPEERLAEIKSFDEIIGLLNYLNIELLSLPDILNTQQSQRLLRGYHYNNNLITVPLIEYFTNGNRQDLLNEFDLSNDIKYKLQLKERLKFGFPISVDEYAINMHNLILKLNKNFKNKVKIQKF